MAVLGPNGRGKTTLLRCAAGVLHPREGEVRRRCPVGFVPQAFGSAFAYRALDMVLMGRARHLSAWSSPGRRDRAIANDALQRVGMTALSERPFPTLSGGEQQLVLVARAICSESEVLMLDEPASALDLSNQGRVLTLLRSLANDGLGVVLTTHNPDHAQRIADDVVLMGANGVRCGTKDSLLDDDALTDLYGVRVKTVRFEHEGVSGRALAILDGPT